jgi:hypothetical protein
VKKCSVTVYCDRKTSGADSRQIFTGFFELARADSIDPCMVEQDWNPGYEILDEFVHVEQLLLLPRSRPPGEPRSECIAEGTRLT